MSRLHASRDEFAGLDAKKSAARDAAAAIYGFGR